MYPLDTHGILADEEPDAMSAMKGCVPSCRSTGGKRYRGSVTVRFKHESMFVFLTRKLDYKM